MQKRVPCHSPLLDFPQKNCFENFRKYTIFINSNFSLIDFSLINLNPYLSKVKQKLLHQDRFPEIFFSSIFTLIIIQVRSEQLLQDRERNKSLLKQRFQIKFFAIICTKQQFRKRTILRKSIKIRDIAIACKLFS